MHTKMKIIFYKTHRLIFTLESALHKFIKTYKRIESLNKFD